MLSLQPFMPKIPLHFGFKVVHVDDDDQDRMIFEHEIFEPLKAREPELRERELLGERDSLELKQYESVDEFKAGFSADKPDVVVTDGMINPPMQREHNKPETDGGPEVLQFGLEGGMPTSRLAMYSSTEEYYRGIVGQFNETYKKEGVKPIALIKKGEVEEMADWLEKSIHAKSGNGSQK